MYILANAENQNIRIVTAESLTAGMISAKLANISGASLVLNGGFNVYQDEMKSSLLGVAPKLLEEFSAVSGEVAQAMAEGALEKTGDKALGDKASNLAIAVTGYADANGQPSPFNDSGLVYIAIARKFGEAAAPQTDVYEHRFDGDRNEVREQTLDAALTYVHDMICGKGGPYL